MRLGIFWQSDLDTGTKLYKAESPQSKELAGHKCLKQVMTIKHTEKPRKKSQLLSKGMNNLAADMAQLIDDPGAKSNSEVVIFPYSSVTKHPSCSLSD